MSLIDILKKNPNNHNNIIYNYYYDRLKQYNIDMYEWGDFECDTDINYIMTHILLHSNLYNLTQETIDIILLSCFAEAHDINIIMTLVEKYGANLYRKITVENYTDSCFDFAQWSEYGSTRLNYIFEHALANNVIIPITTNTLYQIMDCWGDIQLFRKALYICKKFKIELQDFESLNYSIINKYKYDYIYPLLKYGMYIMKNIIYIPEYVNIKEWMAHGYYHPFDSTEWYHTAMYLTQLGVINNDRFIL
jgi:hypothetical protein